MMSISVSHPPDHFRMTTEILLQITTPDRLDARFGPLTFTDGFPDDATVRKVYDNVDFQRGASSAASAGGGACFRPRAARAIGNA